MMMIGGRRFRRLAVLAGVFAFSAPGGGTAESRAASRPAAARSAVHPVNAVPSTTALVRAYGQPDVAPRALVYQSGGRTLYSRAVNQLTAYAEAAGGATWLGTRLGVKRIDAKTGTVRHYTTLDGLPGDVITAIAADRSEAWCMLAGVNDARPVLELCRLEPKSDRWRKIRHLPVPSAEAAHTDTTSTSFPQRPVVAVTDDFVCFAAGRVGRDAEAVMTLWDRRERRWREVGWDPELRADNPYLAISFSMADRDGVWLGTNLGLLRYAWRGGWRRFLPDRAVHAGALRGGALYLACRARNPSFDPRGSNDAGSLARLVPETGERREWPLGRPGSPRYDAGPLDLSIAEDGAVWVSQRGGEDNGRPGPIFHRFDPRAEEWQALDSGRPEYLPAVPDAALRSLVLGSSRPEEFWRPPSRVAATALAARLPAWFCPESPLPPEVERGPGSVTRIEEPGDAVWTFAENALQHTEGVRLDRFPIGDVRVATRPPAFSVVRLGETLFVLTSRGMQALDLKTGIWRQVFLPSRVSGESYNSRLTPDGNRLLIQNRYDRAVLRYDPATEEFSAAAPPGDHVLLGAGPRGAVWLRAQSGPLLRADRAMPGAERTPPRPIVPALPATLLSPPNASPPRALAVSGDIAWHYVSVLSEGRTRGALIGYDTKTEAWTPPLLLGDASYGSRSELSVLPDGEGGAYVTPGDPASSVQRYSRKARRWSVVAPPVPTEPGWNQPELALVSVDAERVWLLAASPRALWEWDRKESSWKRYPLPASPDGSSGWPGQLAARHGGFIFAGSPQGVWRFRIKERAWDVRSLPIPARGQFSAARLAADTRSVWAVLYLPGTSHSFAGRFDRQARIWTFWDEESGFPGHGSVDRLVADGVTAWVLQNGGAYRFDPSTNRWEDLTRAMRTEPRRDVSVRHMEFDTEAVWLLTTVGPATGGALGGSSRPAVVPLLWRWDRSTGALTSYHPPSMEGDSSRGRGFLVEPDRIWIAAGSSVYRFDKATRSWHALGPAEAPPFTPERIVRAADGALWFVDRDNALRSERDARPSVSLGRQAPVCGFPHDQHRRAGDPGRPASESADHRLPSECGEPSSNTAGVATL